MAKKSVKVDEDLIRGYMAGREPDNVSKNETSVQEILNEAITTEEEPVEEVVQEKPKPRKKKEESNYRQKYLMNTPMSGRVQVGIWQGGNLIMFLRMKLLYRRF